MFVLDVRVGGQSFNQSGEPVNTLGRHEGNRFPMEFSKFVPFPPESSRDFRGIVVVIRAYRPLTGIVVAVGRALKMSI